MLHLLHLALIYLVVFGLALGAEETSGIDETHVRPHGCATRRSQHGCEIPHEKGQQCAWLTSSNTCVDMTTLGIFACEQSSDCVAIPISPPGSGCCNHGYRIAVNSSKASQYDQLKHCVPTTCKPWVTHDRRLPICSGEHKCEMVFPGALG